jgi:hypothetical protein
MKSLVMMTQVGQLSPDYQNKKKIGKGQFRSYPKDSMVCFSLQ